MSQRGMPPGSSLPPCARTRQLAQHQTQVESSYEDELPPENVFVAAQWQRFMPPMS